MDVGVYGFEWKLARSVSWEELKSRLPSGHNKGRTIGAHERFLLTAEIGPYFGGIFITKKDQTKLAEIFNDKGQLKAQIRKLPPGHRPMEFNFFVLNQKTLKGVYQHYYSSANLGIFCTYVQDDFIKVKDAKRSEILRQAKAQNLRDNEVMLQLKTLGGTFQWAQIVRTESLSELLNEFQKIKEFSFHYSEYFAKEPTFRPLGEYFNNVQHKFSFVRPLSTQRVGQAIIGAVSGGKLSRFKIKGVDNSGHDWIVKSNYTLQVPDVFDRYDYEDIVTEDNLNLSDLASAPILKELSKIIHNNKEIFGAVK